MNYVIGINTIFHRKFEQTKQKFIYKVSLNLPPNNTIKLSYLPGKTGSSSRAGASEAATGAFGGAVARGFENRRLRQNLTLLIKQFWTNFMETFRVRIVDGRGLMVKRIILGTGKNRTEWHFSIVSFPWYFFIII